MQFSTTSMLDNPLFPDRDQIKVEIFGLFRCLNMPCSDHSFITLQCYISHDFIKYQITFYTNLEKSNLCNNYSLKGLKGSNVILLVNIQRVEVLNAIQALLKERPCL